MPKKRPHQTPQCLSPPQEDKKAVGSWPVLPSPLGARLRSGTEDNGGLSWHCHPSGCPMPRANREQKQRYRGVLGPLPLVCLGHSRSGGASSILASAAPNLASTHRESPVHPAGCWAKLASSGFIFGHLEMARRCPLWGSEQLHSQGL